MASLPHPRRRGTPYVTDTHYCTPPSLCNEETWLRDAILRRDYSVVDQMLNDFGTRQVRLSGGIIDVGLRCGSAPVVNTETPPQPREERASPIQPRDVSYMNKRRSSLGMGHKHRQRTPISTDDSDEEIELMAKRQRDAAESLLLYGRHDPNLTTRGGIVVPATSLPASSPPLALRFDRESSRGDWHDDLRDVGGSGAQTLGGRPLASSREDAAALAGGSYSLAVVRRLLMYAYFDVTYCGPACVAVQLDDPDALKCILRDQRFDPNTGCPLRVAVLLDRMTCFALLIDHPRINPNRGAPLYYAALHSKVWAVRPLMDHPHIQLNRYATGTSSTPLIGAIRACVHARGDEDHRPVSRNASGSRSIPMVPRTAEGGGITPPSVQAAIFVTSTTATQRADAEGTSPTTLSDAASEIVKSLITNPRLDVNKGFSLTPLQLAATQGDVEIVRLLLSRPNAAPNRAIGVLSTPLDIAIESDDAEMVKVLLSDPRTYVTEETVNQLEAANNVPILQLVANLSQDVRIGFLWSMRCLAMIALATMLWAVSICDVVLIASSLALDIRSYAIWTLAIHFASCIVMTFVLARRHNGFGPVAWYVGVVPFLPIPESIMAVHVVQWLFADYHDLFFRQKMFELFFSVSLVRGVVDLLPRCVLRAAIMSHGTRALRSQCAVGLLFGVVGVLLCVAVRMMQIPQNHRASDPAKVRRASTSAVSSTASSREIAV